MQMKSTKEIDLDILAAKASIQSIRETAEDEKKRNRAENALVSKIEVYKKARIYMEGSPQIEHVLSQKDFAERSIDIYDKKYREWLAADEKRQRLVSPKPVFNEQCDVDTKQITKWKTELKFLNYILS